MCGVGAHLAQICLTSTAAVLQGDDRRPQAASLDRAMSFVLAGRLAGTVLPVCR
jgi:hypothetical protein